MKYSYLFSFGFRFPSPKIFLFFEQAYSSKAIHKSLGNIFYAIKNPNSVIR